MKGIRVTGAAIPHAVKVRSPTPLRARQAVDFVVGHLLRHPPCGHATPDDLVYDLVGSLATMRMQMDMLISRTTLRMTRWRMPCRRSRPTLSSTKMKMPMR